MLGPSEWPHSGHDEDAYGHICLDSYSHRLKLGLSGFACLGSNIHTALKRFSWRKNLPWSSSTLKYFTCSNILQKISILPRVSYKVYVTWHFIFSHCHLSFLPFATQPLLSPKLNLGSFPSSYNPLSISPSFLLFSHYSVIIITRVHCNQFKKPIYNITIISYNNLYFYNMTWS